MQTVELKNRPAVIAYASVVGKKEGEGPLGALFDEVNEDNTLGKPSWEKAESELQKAALRTAIHKAALQNADIDCVFAGDLLNQCISSSFGLRDFEIPLIGLYGACSTMALSLSMAAQFVDSGAAKRAAAVTSSHFCSAERQFRLPLEYGGQRPPTAQWTVTGSGAVILASTGGAPYVHSFTIGKIVDLGVKDSNNMGAAMAPAASDTISAHLRQSGARPSDYDLIATGDLGQVGSELLYELLQREGLDIAPRHNDCGLMIFDRKKQDVHAGGSGCGCSASVLCSDILGRMKKGELRRVLFCATGALMSTTSSQQGESIPGIAHAVELRI